MRLFIYCPICGKKGIKKHSEKSVQCSCGFLFYQNVAATASCIIETPKGILLTCRKKEPKKGLLDLPGGFVDKGESLEKALVREMKEELDLRLDKFTYLCSFPNIYPYKGVTYYTTDSFFSTQLPKIPKLRFDEEIAEVLFQKPEQIQWQKIGFISARKAVAYYLLHYH